MKVMVLVPVHLDSKRLPRKALLEYKGKTLLEYTLHRIKTSSFFSDVGVVTSDVEVAEATRGLGVRCFCTHRIDIATGTHRIAKLVHDERELDRFDFFVNWQVDEPFVDPLDVQLMLQNEVGYDDIGTLVYRLSEQDKRDPNAVKVVWLPDGFCLWFTRASIQTKYGHIGVYGYHRKALDFFYTMGRQQTPYAFNERLEQLNWLERTDQFSILGRFVNYPYHFSINTHKDWERFKELDYK